MDNKIKKSVKSMVKLREEEKQRHIREFTNDMESMINDFGLLRGLNSSTRTDICESMAGDLYDRGYRRTEKRVQGARRKKNESIAKAPEAGVAHAVEGLTSELDRQLEKIEDEVSERRVHERSAKRAMQKETEKASEEAIANLPQEIKAVVKNGKRSIIRPKTPSRRAPQTHEEMMVKRQEAWRTEIIATFLAYLDAGLRAKTVMTNPAEAANFRDAGNPWGPIINPETKHFNFSMVEGKFLCLDFIIEQDATFSIDGNLWYPDASYPMPIPCIDPKNRPVRTSSYGMSVWIDMRVSDSKDGYSNYMKMLRLNIRQVVEKLVVQTWKGISDRMRVTGSVSHPPVISLSSTDVIRENLTTESDDDDRILSRPMDVPGEWYGPGVK